MNTRKGLIAVLMLACATGCGTFATKPEEKPPAPPPRAETPAPKPEVRFHTARVVIQAPYNERWSWGLGETVRATQEILSSSRLYEQAAKAADLIPDSWDAAAAQKMAADLGARTQFEFIETVAGTPLTITLRDPDPSRALALVQAMAPIIVERLQERSEHAIRETYYSKYRPAIVSERSYDEALAAYKVSLGELNALLQEAGLHAVRSISDAWKLEHSLNESCNRQDGEIQKEELLLAEKKAAIRSLQERLAQETEEARTVESDDPIVKELEELVKLATRDYERSLENLETEEAREAADQKKRGVVEARLQLLKRKEALAQRAEESHLREARKKLADMLSDASIAAARIEQKKAQLDETRADLNALEAIKGKHKDLWDKVGTIAAELDFHHELLRGRAVAQQVTIVDEPALVVSPKAQ